MFDIITTSTIVIAIFYGGYIVGRDSDSARLAFVEQHIVHPYCSAATAIVLDKKVDLKTCWIAKEVSP